MSPNRADHCVLIIAADVLVGAIAGSLVEGADLKAAFPSPGERVEDALRRVRPLAAILIDAVANAAESDLFVQRARKRGVAVMLFGTEPDIERLRIWADQRGVMPFVIPEQLLALRAALMNMPAHSRSRAEQNDRRARVERNTDGRLVFHDRSGRRWSIYDRRGGDRRSVHRRFISDEGDVLGCDLTPSQAKSHSLVALQQQLNRAVPDWR